MLTKCYINVVFFQKIGLKQVRVGTGGPRWVQVGHDDDLDGGQEEGSQDHLELPHHEGNVMHSQ